jgi:sulfite oxidase
LTTAKAVTLSSLHFVRNHSSIPIIDEEKYHFDMDGCVEDPKKFTIADLKNESKFPRITKMATIQCSGTRRTEQIKKYAG